MVGKGWWRGGSRVVQKNRLSLERYFLYTVDVLLLWFPFSQLQKGAGALSLQELHSFQTPELDRQVPKVTTGGGEGGGHVKEHFRSFPLVGNVVISLLVQISPAFAPFSHQFSTSASLYPRFKRSTLE